MRAQDVIANMIAAYVVESGIGARPDQREALTIADQIVKELATNGITLTDNTNLAIEPAIPTEVTNA